MRERTTVKYLASVIAGLVLLLLFTALGLSVGATYIPVENVVGALCEFCGGSAPSDVDTQVIREIRLPRVVLAAVVGASLAVCGLITQALLKNPLGDPYLLGISSGASTGAALIIVVGASVPWLGTLGLSFGAFLGAVLAIVIVAILAGAQGAMSPARIIFAGMAVNFFFSALTSLIILMAKSNAGTKSVMFWMLGSLGSASWPGVLLAGAVAAIGLGVFFLFGRRTDLLSLGDNSARSLGTNPRTFRGILLACIAAVVSVMVSLTGAIGFIGLVVPHFAKYLVGPTTRTALPITALTGAVLIVATDCVARILVAPAELPIGILTALAGTPLLMLLIKNYAR